MNDETRVWRNVHLTIFPGIDYKQEIRNIEDEQFFIVPDAKPRKKMTKFRCHLCRRQYETAHTLQRHKREIHEGQKYSCPFCDQEYSRKYKLNHHIENVHKENFMS